MSLCDLALEFPLLLHVKTRLGVSMPPAAAGTEHKHEQAAAVIIICD